MTKNKNNTEKQRNRNATFKAVSMLVDKGHSVLHWDKTGEVAGVKIQTKAIPLKTSIRLPYI
jgi:hypothetical protein